MEKSDLLDTRATLNHLLDYALVFNEEANISDAAKLIAGIPSVALLVHIGQINLSLYLHDSREAGQLVQNKIVKSFTAPYSPVLKKVIGAYEKIVAAGMWPTVFYRYSNLLFYELIFSNFNDLPGRDLTLPERENILKAYLIINGVVNSRITIKDHEADDAFNNNTIEQVLVPNFIYQHDYRSNVDFSNQFTRAVRFFEYLDRHPKYGLHMPAFYQSLQVRSATELIYRVSEIFTLMRNVGKGEPKLTISTADDPAEPHNQLLMNLAIEPANFHYKKDDSFRQFRNKMFVFTPGRKFLLLDIGFLVDYLYKTQIFSLSGFFKEKGLNNFLSDKAAEFMEQIYMPEIMKRCFPAAKIYSGKELIKGNKEELTDLVVAKNGCMLAVEFKDTILNSKSKNSGNRSTLFDALDMKFLEDEGPKGIAQLRNAIRYLEKVPAGQSEFPFDDIHTIYPVVIYTDNAFGFDGINKIFKEKFRTLLSQEGISRFQICDVTFINLSFFEINENYLSSGQIDIFKLVEGYHKHTSQLNSLTTPFEVFATAERNNKSNRPADSTNFFKEMMAEVFRKFRIDLGIV